MSDSGFYETGKKLAQDSSSRHDWEFGWSLLSPHYRPLFVLLCPHRRRILIKQMRELFPRSGDGANEIAQWIKELAAKSDDVSPILRDHTVEGQSKSPKLFSDLHTHAVECTPLLLDTNLVKSSKTSNKFTEVKVIERKKVPTSKTR